MVYYIFIYCLKHDDGYVIKSDSPKIPLNYKIISEHNCSLDDWIYTGILDYDSTNFEQVMPILKDYKKYNGGFYFEFYINNITDENGNFIDDKKIKQWIMNNL